jgi:hypothetical protein
VIGQHSDPAADIKTIESSREHRGQGLHLTVNGNPQGLEGTLGGMAVALATHCGRNSFGNNLDEPPRSLDGLAVTFGNDGANNAVSELFLTVLAKHTHQGTRIRLIEDLGSSTTTGLVHPHVQRGINRVREPALNLVNLERGQPKVKQYGVDIVQAEIVKHLRKFVMNSVDEMNAVCKRLKPRLGHCQGLLIAIDTDQLNVRESPQNSLSMTSHTEGAINMDTSTTLENDSKKVEDTGTHDGDMDSIATNGIGRHEHPFPGMICQQRLRPVSMTRDPRFRSG